MPSPQREAPILVGAELALSRLRWRGHRACVVYRRSVGLFTTTWGTPITVGVPGQCDLYGYLITGRGLEVETKSPTGELSRQQRRWRDVCLEMNVLWVLARSPEFACAEVLRALEESS